ncbi:MAG: type II toxin-antitoxin system VapC family toxin [Chloroflexaceae bacterium]|nr:type II toxin-antitoxin system VapC family toxin [Chloroflexaceae bacterium]
MVIDASVLLRAFFPDEQQMQAQALVRDFVTGQLGLLAPSLLPYEITNAVWQAIRRSRLTTVQGEAILTAFTDLHIPLATVGWQQVLFLARQFNCSAYDAAYLGLAQISGQSLITADERLYNAVQPHLSWIHWLGDYQAGTFTNGETTTE